MPQTAIVFLDRHAVARRHPALRRVPLEGRDPRRGAGPAASTGPFVLLMLVAFLTAFYMFRVVFLAFFGHGDASRRRTRRCGSGGTGTRPPSARSHHAPHDPPAVMTLPLWILALLSLGDRRLLHAHRPRPALRTRAKCANTRPAWLTPAAVGVAVAGIAAGLAHLSAPRDQRGPARRDVRADPPRGAREVLARRPLRGSTASRCWPSRGSSAGSTATSSTAS